MSRHFRKISTMFIGLIFALPLIPLQADEKPLSLWLLETEEAKVYLLGSIHAMKPDMYPLAAPIETAFKEAEKVAFEVDLTRLNETEMNQIMQQQGIYTPPSSIESDLSEETLSLLKTYLKANNLSLANVRHMKPWFLMLTIGQKELSKYGFEPQYGIDQKLQQRAISEGKEILQLESFREQIGILSADSIEVQGLSLKASLEEMKTLENDLKELIVAWEHGDVDKMLELTIEASNQYPGLSQQMHNLIDKRNIKMTEIIREYAATSGTYLVVVGALHMGGEGGIIQLLKKDFTITQLKH